MNGQGYESLVSALQADPSHDAQKVGQEGSSIPKSPIDDLCQTGTTGMTHEEWGGAIERALAAAKSHLNEWQFSGDVTRLWAADRHIKHLIALSRMEPVQPRSQP